MDRIITKLECVEQENDGLHLRKNVLTVVSVWYRNYKTRKALAEMSDRLLDDIGISPMRRDKRVVDLSGNKIGDPEVAYFGLKSDYSSHTTS